MASDEGFHRGPLHRLGVGVGRQNLPAGEGGVHGHRRDGHQHPDLGVAEGNEQGADVFQRVQDLFVVQQVELVALRYRLAPADGQHAVQVEAGLGVVPGLGQAQGHDEHPRLPRQGHVAGDRPPPLPDLLERRKLDRGMQVRIEPLARLQLKIGRLGKRLRRVERPPQLVQDREHHISIQQGVGICLEAEFLGGREAAGGDVVALDRELLFDVAGEAGADGEDQFLLVDPEGGREARLSHGHQALGLRLGRARPPGIGVACTVQGLVAGQDQKRHPGPFKKPARGQGGTSAF